VITQEIRGRLSDALVAQTAAVFVAATLRDALLRTKEFGSLTLPCVFVLPPEVSAGSPKVATGIFRQQETNTFTVGFSALALNDKYGENAIAAIDTVRESALNAILAYAPNYEIWSPLAYNAGGVIQLQDFDGVWLWLEKFSTFRYLNKTWPI
jgi:hypothetical protein